jgi:hypothetical protein
MMTVPSLEAYAELQLLAGRHVDATIGERATPPVSERSHRPLDQRHGARSRHGRWHAQREGGSGSRSGAPAAL